MASVVAMVGANIIFTHYVNDSQLRDSKLSGNVNKTTEDGVDTLFLTMVWAADCKDTTHWSRASCAIPSKIDFCKPDKMRVLISLFR